MRLTWNETLQIESVSRVHDAFASKYIKKQTNKQNLIVTAQHFVSFITTKPYLCRAGAMFGKKGGYHSIHVI